MGSVLSRLRAFLVPTDGVERHVATAALVGRPSTILDVGGISGHLAPYVLGAHVTTVNVDPNADVVIAPGPHALPFADASFDAAVSLDTLEHIPRDDRSLFVSELLRVARTRVVLCCPLGTPQRRELELADDAFYQALTGSPHPWIHEHLVHVVPTLADLEALFERPGWTSTFQFNGDSRVTSRQFRLAEASQHTRRPRAMARWFLYRARHRPDVELQADAGPFTNRVFVVATPSAPAAEVSAG